MKNLLSKVFENVSKKFLFKRRFPLLLSTYMRFSSIMGISIVLQLYMIDLGANLFHVGLLSTLRGIAAVSFSPIWGILSDRKDRKSYLILSSFISLIVLLFYPTASTVILLMVLVFIFSLANAGFNPIATALSSESSEKRGIEISFFNSALAAGNFTSRVMMGVFLIWISVRVSLWLFALVFAFSIIPLFFIKERERNPKFARKRNFLMNVEDFHLMKNNGLWSVYIASFMRQAGTSGWLSLIAVYLVYAVKLSPSTVGFISGLNPLVQIFSTLYFAKLVEKRNAKQVMIVGMLLSALSPFLLAIVKNSIGASIAFGILGLGYGAFISGTTTYISFATPSDLRGRFMGLFSSSRSMGSIVGPLVAGGVATILGYKFMFFLMVAFEIASFFVIKEFFKEKDFSTK